MAIIVSPPNPRRLLRNWPEEHMYDKCCCSDSSGIRMDRPSHLSAHFRIYLALSERSFTGAKRRLWLT